MQDYKMLRVKAETYKQLKQLALDFDIQLTKLIVDILLYGGEDVNWL